MATGMLLTMCLCFALSISVAVSIGLSAMLGIWWTNASMLIAVKEMFSSINSSAASRSCPKLRLRCSGMCTAILAIPCARP